jgi:hypothetical protein
VTAELPVVRAADIEATPAGQSWLIESLWSRAAVGVVGGFAKLGKSWLGLDMAVSVASATPCLGRFAVDHPGDTLVYLAEDALPDVRGRIDALCRHRKIAIEALPLHVVTAPSLRLDLEADRARLTATLARIRPRLLLLDPLVRIHRLDENSAQDIAGLLGFLRELNRAFELAVVLVHHAGKKRRQSPGQALRGSSDIFAWTDSSLFLARRKSEILLTAEHRAAPSPVPMILELVTGDDGRVPHLEIRDHRRPTEREATPGSLADSLLDELAGAGRPLSRTALRDRLRVKNERLGNALVDLERRGLLSRTPQGWKRTASGPAASRSDDPDTLELPFS